MGMSNAVVKLEFNGKVDEVVEVYYVGSYEDCLKYFRLFCDYSDFCIQIVDSMEYFLA